MRHRVYGKHFGRDKNERKALFKGLVHSLLLHGTIQISEVKAKAIKGLVDKIINSAKRDLKVSGQPLIAAFLNDKNLQERVKKEILPKMGDKNSGYTRVIRIGARLGDQTNMVKMSLIGAEELKPILKEKSDKQSLQSKDQKKQVKSEEETKEIKVSSKKEKITKKETKPTVKKTEKKVK